MGFDRIISKYKLDFKKIREIDKPLLIATILITLYGILNIYLCTKGEYGTQFVKKQIVFFVLALVILYVFMAVDYTVIYSYVPLFYWGCVALLILTMFIGVEINGAKGWIDLKVTMLQPAELAKIGIILMLAKKIEEMDGDVNNLKNFMTLAFYAIVPVIFIIIQPDMGMTMVCFFCVLGIYFIAGLDKRVILGGLGALFLVFVLLWNSGLIKDYQKGRITSFMNPEADTSGEGYHLNQSLVSIGSGGILGNTPSFKNDGSSGYAAQHVPEIQTDFIFAAISEQWGLIGALLLLFLYGVLISRMINIARTAKDHFGSIICAGMISYFLFAILQNIGMTIALVPITGITLPLISYGGSSLLTTVMSIGLVLNVGMRRKKIHF